MIERWYNKDQKRVKEIADNLNKSERTIRREIRRGKVIIKDSLWADVEIYSADISQKEYEINGSRSLRFISYLFNISFVFNHL